MFMRIQVSVRRTEHLKKDSALGIAYVEKNYEDDLVGEMQASEDGAKAVNAAIDKLHKEEEERGEQ